MSSFASLARGFLLSLAACGGQLSSADGGTQVDASKHDGCVDIEPAQFDTSCNTTTDCVAVPAGTFCAGYTCSCPDGTINASSQSAYESLLATVPQGALICGCPLLGAPRCIASQCVFCPNPSLKPSTFPPGCPTSQCEEAGGTCKPVSQNQCMGGGTLIGSEDCDAGSGCCQ